MNPGPSTEPANKAAVDAMMPEFLKQEATKEAETAKQTTQSNVEVGALLADRIVEARRDGRNDIADELKDLLGQVTGATTPKRVRKKHTIHPALQKLRRNLGLKKVEPVEIEWAGSKWRFALAPPAADHWVAIMSEQSAATNFSALKIAASLVGLDGAPLYEVFNVETVVTFESEGDEPITVRAYEKRCDACSEMLAVETTECPSCGSLHDPFDVPLNLRLRCIELVHQFFIEDFGLYEELRELYLEMRKVLPDRVADKEKLYGPFLTLSPESSQATDTTPSGDAP